MLAPEDVLMIKAQVKAGVYHKDLAAELGVHPKTISRALKRAADPPPIRPPRSSKLDPFVDTIERLLAEQVWNSVVILREIQALGYTGSSSLLRAYLTPRRTQRPSRATVRFETDPGQQLQCDWGAWKPQLAGARRTIHCMVNQLAYSRRFHVWATTTEDAEHTYDGLIRSFEYFGGVPHQVVVDNQKAAVLIHGRDGRVLFNPRFLDLAGHYGFVPHACHPYRPQTKGKDERMVGYVKQHFFQRYRTFDSLTHLNQCLEEWLHRPQTKGKDERMVGYVKQHFFQRYRTFDSLTHLNQCLEEWLHTEADQRIHSTLHERVADRFAREAPTLQPLPTTRYDTAYHETRKVAVDGYINVRGNRYSVPADLIGHVVSVWIGLDDTLRVIQDDATVVAHTLRPASTGWVTVPAHHAALWDATLRVEHRDLTVYEEVAQWNS